MRAQGTKWVLAGLLVVAALAGLSMAGSATASVKTTAGRVLQGALSGLAPILRLEDPTPPVGPATQLEIALDSIQQIWIDFPRVVIETAEHVIVGPYAAFAGIAQLLRIEDRGSVTEVPFAAVEAIAFNGAAFAPLPREWLGLGWLNQMPYMVNKKTAQMSSVAAAPAPAAPTRIATPIEVAAPLVADEGEAADEEIVWNGATPEVAPATSNGELPWWTVLIALAVVVALFLFVPTGS